MPFVFVFFRFRDSPLIELSVGGRVGLGMTFGLSHSEGETDEDEEEEIYLFILLISKCSEEFNPPFPVIGPPIVIICTNFHQNQGE